jgi:hypothetical protein
MPLLLVFYYYIHQGVRGAKTFFLVIYAFVLFHLPRDRISPRLYDKELEVFNLVMQHGLQLLACVLLLLSRLGRPAFFYRKQTQCNINLHKVTWLKASLL